MVSNIDEILYRAKHWQWKTWANFTKDYTGKNIGILAFLANQTTLLVKKHQFEMRNFISTAWLDTISFSFYMCASLSVHTRLMVKPII